MIWKESLEPLKLGVKHIYHVWHFFVKDMCRFCGKEYRIKAIYDPVNNIYDLETITGDEDENKELLYFCWDEVMLIPIAGKLEIMIKERRKNV